MNSEALQNLPVEMQQRLAQIMVQGQAQETDASRQEMAQLAQVIQANSNVVEGVGQAVGTIYQMFQQTSNPTATYSQSFTEAPASSEDY